MAMSDGRGNFYFRMREFAWDNGDVLLFVNNGDV